MSSKQGAFNKSCALCLIGCAAVMLTARLVAPSALQRFDQPKTASYTADMIVNGRWLLPRDMLGHIATKPPLVNWLAAPFLAVGFWTEWAVKFPMIAGTLISTALIVWMARRLFREMDETRDVATGAACIAGIAWLVNPANLTMIYHCRPDPVLVTFLTAAWILGTIFICEKETPNSWIVAAFWISVGLAALTKGPAALVPILYLPLAARLLGNRWSLVGRSQWWWGLPLASAIFLAWAVPAAIQYREPFFKVLVGKQLIAQALGLGEQFGRRNITSEGPIVALKHIGENPTWFLGRFAPWSLFAIGGLCVIGWRRWFSHRLAPAIGWVFLVLVFFGLSAHKTADYIIPAYAAAAILAAYFCATFLGQWRIQLWQVAVAGFALAIGFGIAAILTKDRAGDNLKFFARKIDNRIGEDPVVFIDTGFNTLQFFLHRHQGRDPTPEQMSRAAWAIMPLQAEIDPELRSELVPQIQEKRFVLGLYRIEQVRSLLDQNASGR